jgi:type IX secretion system PorP/SprF family membrane protein
MTQIFKHLLLILLFFIASRSEAQTLFVRNPQLTEPVLSQYDINQLVYNPGYAGAIDGSELNFSTQNLTNILDTLATKSYLITYNTSLSDSVKSGVGVSLLYHYESQWRDNLLLSVSYAYNFKVGNNANLKVGASMGLGRKSQRLFEGSIQSNNFVGRVGKVYYDMGFGFWFTAKNFFFGASNTHINRAQIEFTSQNKASVTPMYYVMTGYDITIKELFKVTPSFFMRYQSSSSVMGDFMVNANFDDNIIAGLGYRTDIGRKFVPNPNNPIEQVRFSQVIVNLGAGFADKYRTIVSWDYHLKAPTVAMSRSTVEITFTYKFI